MASQYGGERITDYGVGREDSRNVNGWHWQETDILPFCKSKLEEVFRHHLGPALTGVLTVTGDATVNTRKGKRILGYDLFVEGGLTLDMAGTKITGSIRIPSLSDEQDAKDVEVVVDVKDVQARQHHRAALIEASRKAVADFIVAVKEDQGGPAAPKPKALPDVVIRETAATPAAKPAAVSAAPTSTATASSSSSYSIEELFGCGPPEVWECLTHPGRIQAWTRAPCSLTATAGSAFTMFDGAITGTFTAVNPEEYSFQQDWRMAGWPQGVVSKIKLSVVRVRDGVTKIKLAHSGLPSEEQKELAKKGFETHFQRIKQTFGYVAPSN